MSKSKRTKLLLLKIIFILLSFLFAVIIFYTEFINIVTAGILYFAILFSLILFYFIIVDIYRLLFCKEPTVPTLEDKEQIQKLRFQKEKKYSSGKKSLSIKICEKYNIENFLLVDTVIYVVPMIIIAILAYYFLNNTTIAKLLILIVILRIYSTYKKSKKPESFYDDEQDNNK